MPSTGEFMYDEVFYEKPFLNQVVARIDFVASIPGLEKTLPAKLGKLLSDHFPIVEPTETLTHEFQLNVGADEMQQRKTPKKIWNFFGKEREKQLSLGSEYIFVLHTTYSSYEEIRAEFGSIVTAIDGAFPDIKAGRFGLRYVNKIEGEGLPTVAGWEEYISEMLVGPTRFFASESLTRLVHIAELKCGDLDLRFQFGMPNPDYPAVMKRPSFVLDFDAYVQAAHELQTSLQYMDQAHGCIQRLFEQSITNRLRERMNAKTTSPVQE
jgi:uncharacterized protein (TIGR04255 family)